MRITLIGLGKMGSQVKTLAYAAGHEILPPSALSQADVVIDFALAEGVLKRIETVATHQKPLVIGTTGWEELLPQAKTLIDSHQTALLYSPNFSIGVALFIQLLKTAATLLPGYEKTGIEWHHKGKKDSPSGTSKMIGAALDMEKPFTSVRLGRVAGKHEVVFSGPHDSISLTHESHNREGFAQGALLAAQWIQDKKGWYTLDDMVRSLYSSHHPL